jgi:glycosyltransferase involved in cell wall biosynthesis
MQDGDEKLTRSRVSACVITFNEEDNIRRCLDSLTWCDEIVVVDSYSTDRTPEICRTFTDRFYQHEWRGYIGQRNLIRTMAECPWILFLDADEEVSPGLKAEIQRALSETPDRHAGYEFPRQVYYLGRWIRFGSWYPDYKLRLFRKGKGTIGGVEPHDQVHVQGPVGRMKHPIWHYTYADISDHIRTMNRFSTISSRALYDQGQRFNWIDFLFRPGWRFFKGFVLRSGWLDGRRGFIIAMINAFGVTAKYAKLWEIQWSEQTARAALKAKAADPTDGPETS